MAKSRNFDYPTITKRGFWLGVTLFVVGGVAEVVGHAYFSPLPAWEETLLLNAEIFGILVALFVPLVFGIVLPLTE